MAFKRAHHRANFDSSMTTSEIETFVDEIYYLCDTDGVDGLIIENSGMGSFILEGDDKDVDDVLAVLVESENLGNNDTYLTETGSAVFSCLASHVSGDARDDSC
jgi:putative protein kinase ArgK-like GTPase of G3E family